MKRNKTPNFAAQMAPDEIVEFFIYDEIGGWGIWAEDVALALRQQGTMARLRLRFHSPGGDMQEAAAIRALLQAAMSSGQIGTLEATVDGRAYSAATHVAMLATHITMSPLGLWMIHRPRVRIDGNSDELRQSADVADELEEAVNLDYAQRTGQSLPQIIEWVRGDNGATDGTVFSAQSALEAGFVDEIMDASPALQPTEEIFDNQITEQAYASLFANKEAAPSERPVFLNSFCRVPKTLHFPMNKNGQPSDIRKARYTNAQITIAEILGS